MPPLLSRYAILLAYVPLFNSAFATVFLQHTGALEFALVPQILLRMWLIGATVLVLAIFLEQLMPPVLNAYSQGIWGFILKYYACAVASVYLMSLALGFSAQPAGSDIADAGIGPLFIGFLEVCVIAASRYSLTQKQRSDRLAYNLKLAQYKALQTQLNPYFLFNTPNHISADVMDAPENAVFMLDELADLLRGILNHVTKTMVTLEQELVLLQHYLTLQENRFGDRLRVEIACSEESRRALIPPMMLQIIV